MTDEQFKYEYDDECNCDCSIITYDSLISRLEEQLEYNNGFAKQDAQNALNFIVWQKEEHYRLLQKMQQLKSEAIKEFAERLKIKVKMYNSEDVDEGDLIDDLLTVGETVEIIDNIVKEMKKRV